MTVIYIHVDMYFLGREYFRCQPCGVDLKGGLSEIQTHEAKMKHRRNMKSFPPTGKSNVFEKNTAQLTLDANVKMNETRLAFFILEHNLPVSVADHLVEFVKSCDRKSSQLQKMTCGRTGRTKCTSIIENVIGSVSFGEVVRLLQGNKFSLMIDESTDVSSKKHLVLVARVLNNNEVQDLFLTLLPVYDCTTQGLYDSIVNFFNTHMIP